MKLNELVDLNSVLQANQYIKLLRNLSTSAENDINHARIKNQVIHSWSKGMTSRKHYDNLLKSIHLSLNDLIK